MKLIATILLFLAAMPLSWATPPNPPWCGLMNDRQAHCYRTKNGMVIWSPGGTLPFSRRYTAHAYDVDGDIPSICHRLWEGLKPYNAECVPWSHEAWKPYCRARKSDASTLEWGFETSLLCDPWKVHAAWYHATKNKYGDIFCCKLD